MLGIHRQKTATLAECCLTNYCMYCVVLAGHWTEWLRHSAFWQSLLISTQCLEWEFDLPGDNFCYLAGIWISFRWVQWNVNRIEQWQRTVCSQQATRQSAERRQRAEHQYSSAWNGDIRQADTDCFLRPREGRWVQATFVVCTKLHIWFVYMNVFLKCQCLILFVTIVERV
jgi:hypothetical protein